MPEKLRPRFRYFVTESQLEVQQKFSEALKNTSNSGFTGSALKYHIVIDYPQNKRHFWSPQLDLNLETYKEGTLIRGLLGPRPNVWTVFMFFYSISIFLGIVGFIIGIGQWSMENPPFAFWSLPISGLLFITVYYIGRVGKQIAHDESIALRNFLLSQLNSYSEIELSDL